MTRGGEPRYQVRLRDGAGELVERTPGSALEAIEVRDAVLDARAAGERYRSASSRTFDPTLAKACEAFLALQQVRLERGELRPKGLGYFADATRVWREPIAHDPNDERATPFAGLRLSELEPLAVDRYLRRTRSAQAPASARNEQQVLKRVLREAQRDGASFDAALLTLEPLPKVRRDRKRRALGAAELDLLVSCAPDYARRMLELAGSGGFRIGELFTLTDDRLALDGEAPHVLIPAELCKERRDKRVPLLPAEVRLLREQLLLRAPGSSLVFPKRHGSPWRYGHFHRFVWRPALKRAALVWRRSHELAEDAPTPFCDLKVHDLRRTAATLMRQAGLELEHAAARIGHADGGRLLLEVYRGEVQADELAEAVAELGDSLAAAVERRDAQRRALAEQRRARRA
jgi:integrase